MAVTPDAAHRIASSVQLSDLTARWIQPGESNWGLALQLALGLEPRSSGAEPSLEVQAFLETAHRRGLRAEALVGAFRDENLVSAVLGLESPGRIAMVLAPWEMGGTVAWRDLAVSLNKLLPVVFSRGAQLVEVLTPATSAATSELLARHGFLRLTTLIYLRRSSSRHADTGVTPQIDRLGLRWINYSVDAEPLFEQAVEATYRQTLDCPELSVVRAMHDVLAGHRAAAEFHPENWSVALREGEPVGVLLLGEHTGQGTMEIVYMGVSQPVRGQGVADALLDRAVRRARERSAKHLALAVDRRNVPARRVYARWGFTETGTRDAWIATPA